MTDSKVAQIKRRWSEVSKSFDYDNLARIRNRYELGTTEYRLMDDVIYGYFRKLKLLRRLGEPTKKLNLP